MASEHSDANARPIVIVSNPSLHDNIFDGITALTIVVAYGVYTSSLFTKRPSILGIVLLLAVQQRAFRQALIRETITLSVDRLQLCAQVGPLRFRREFPLADVTDLEVVRKKYASKAGRGETRRLQFRVRGEKKRNWRLLTPHEASQAERANRQPDGARFRRFRHRHGATRSPGSWSHLQGGLRWIATIMGPPDRQGHGATS